MARMTSHTLTVGFDLDMTLIDSRPGIKAAYQALSAETGTYIDADLAVTRLGPPLEEELRELVPRGADRRRPATATARSIPTHAIAPTPAMPGAREAVDAVHARGGRAIVVTAKYEPNAKLHLAHLGIEADALIGWLWAEAQGGGAARARRAVYVGDHTGDVRGARTAGALSVAVATGPCDAGGTARGRRRVVLPT